MKKEAAKEEDKSKVSLPQVPGQSMASVQELKTELEKARATSNYPLKVSILGTLIRKVEAKQEKIALLEEKFYALGSLKLGKMLEETSQQLMKLDP